MAERTLGDCRVELIDPAEARRLIRRHEHLRTTGNATLFFGLIDPADRVLAAVGFGHGPHGARGDAVLERGFTLPDAPPNAGSRLVGAALRYGRERLGWRMVRAYTDERFGEFGALYRASGFTRCPPSKHGKAWRYALLDCGRVLSDRAIYRRYGSMPAARAADAIIVRLPAREAWEWRAGRAPELSHDPLRDRATVEMALRPCARCAAPFGAARASAKFCSPRCRVAAHRGTR